jgi:hypothetical protein
VIRVGHDDIGSFIANHQEIKLTEQKTAMLVLFLAH